MLTIKVLFSIFVMLYLSVVLGLYFKTTQYSRFDGKRKIVFITPIISITLLMIFLLDGELKIKSKIFTILNFDLFMFFTTYMAADPSIFGVTKKKKVIRRTYRNVLSNRKKIYCTVLNGMASGM